ncbi:MAG: dephospho-CoA kinase [Bacteroidales bacterium]
MIKIGITGGIGSGKSILCTYLMHRGVEIYNCDVQAKRIMSEDAQVRALIIELLGAESYNDNGINRQYIAKRVFSDRELLGSLNSIVHPAVRRDFLTWCESAKSSIVALEAAILFEGGFDSSLDKVITVEASRECRIARVILRDALSLEEVERRIANQMSTEERVEKADFVIYNDEDKLIIPQIESILTTLEVV